tara:strand:+ start:32004 stop:32186 length:183 start_codon:yes stop_codon:yes gene_type:complete
MYNKALEVVQVAGKAQWESRYNVVRIKVERRTYPQNASYHESLPEKPTINFNTIKKYKAI